MWHRGVGLCGFCDDAGCPTERVVSAIRAALFTIGFSAPNHWEAPALSGAGVRNKICTLLGSAGGSDNKFRGRGQGKEVCEVFRIDLDFLCLL